MGTIKRNFSNNVTPTGKFDSADLTGTIPAANVADASLTNITSVPATVGDFVQKVASDPSPVSAGDLWYNTTSNTLKANVFQAAAWASGGNLGTARYQLGGAGDSNSAAVVFGGFNGSTGFTATEEYNGTSWAGGGSLPSQKRGMANAGTQTSALSGGGFTGGSPLVVTTTEEYDGSSWTSGGSLSTKRGFLGGCGLQTAALAVGGASDVPAWVNDVTNVESYNGTAWTSGTALPQAQRGNRPVGTTTAALNIGGLKSPGPGVQISQEYDGSTWTAAGNIITTRYGGGASGIQTSAIFFGGGTPPGPQSAATERYDGTSWASDTSLSSVIFNNASSISSPSFNSLSAGGGAPATVSTEEYTGATVVAQTVTTS
jgi:hypothetical protein